MCAVDTETQRHRHTDTQTHRHRDTDTQTHTHTQTHMCLIPSTYVYHALFVIYLSLPLQPSMKELLSASSWLLYTQGRH